MADWKERYLQLWQKTTKRQRYMGLGVIVLLLALIFGGSYWYGSKPDLAPLFTNMETKDAGEVAAKLKEAKIPYDIQETKQGTTILVPVKNVHSARMELATQGLPRGNKGFEIFDDSKLGVTEFQNKVNYLQALQGELTRTIEQIDVVEKARVHIVLPEDSLYKKNEKPATASIMLKLAPQMKLSKKEIKGIVNLAAHSIQGLTPENITIVDDTGKILNEADDDQNEEKKFGQLTKIQLDLTQKVQERLKNNVQRLLDQALGEGKAFVQVSVELDFDQRQTDKSTFTPVVDESGIIRSQQETSESYTGTSVNPGGPAGTQSNIPGYVATNNNSNATYEKKESTKNYEINEEKQKVVASPGSIRRLNIAVLVIDTLTQAQQDSIRRSVASAVGINTARGDTVSVEPLPFNTDVDRLAAEEKAKREQEEMMLYACIGLIILIILMCVFMYRYHRRRKQHDAEVEAERQAEAAAHREEVESLREEIAQQTQEIEQQRLLAEETAAEVARLDAIRRGEIPDDSIVDGERPAGVGYDEEEEEEAKPVELTPEEKEQLKQWKEVEALIVNKPEEAAALIKTWLAEE